MPFLMSFALHYESVTFAWIDNAFVQLPLNIYATKGSGQTILSGQRAQKETKGTKNCGPGNVALGAV